MSLYHTHWFLSEVLTIIPSSTGWFIFLLTVTLWFTLIQDPVERAKALKEKGNAAYGARKFTEAVEYYTLAIELSPEAVYYSNRAASTWS